MLTNARFRKLSRMLTVLLLLFSTHHTAAAYDNIVTFGDSLTDTGNILALGPVFYDSDQYAGGGFSNGPVWSDHLVDRLGFDGIYLIANVLGGEWDPPEGRILYNSAFGGAQSGSLMAPPGFVSQVELWVQNQIPLPENCLCVIWIGGNDFLNWIDDHQINQDDPTETIAASVTNIVTGLTMLVDPGHGLSANDILVITLPDLGKTPANNGSYGPDNADFASEVTVAFNTALRDALATLAADYPHTRLMTYAVNDIFSRLVANPEVFNFADATHSAWFETAETHGFDNVDGYVFWDEIHPTTEAHRVIANQVYGHLFTPTADPSAVFIDVDGGEALVGLTASHSDFIFHSIQPGSDQDITSTIDRPQTFHYGIFTFNLSVADGETGTVSVLLPEPAPADARWFISTADGWIDFTRSTLNDPNGDGAVFSDDRMRVTLYLTDNGNYDLDDTPGSIDDPSGLATLDCGCGGDSSSTCFIASTTTATLSGTLTGLVVAGLIAAVGWFGWRMQRKTAHDAAS